MRFGRTEPPFGLQPTLHPSKLVYGTEVVLPLHVQKPAFKFASLIELSLDQYQQQRLVQLDLLDEKKTQGNRACSSLSSKDNSTPCQVSHREKILS